MKLKKFFYGFLIIILAISCNKSIIEPEASLTNTAELKAAIIGKTYYISKSGNDNNTGTLASPFLTLQKAANIVNPGDSVIVKDGTYTTTNSQIAIITRSGSSTNRIVFKSQNKWGAVLDGRNNATTQGIYFQSSVGYITFENFDLKGFQDGGIKISSSTNNCIVRGNKIHEIGKMCSDSDSGQEGIYVSTCSNVIVEKNIIYNIGRYAPGESGCTPTTKYWMNHDHGIYVGSNVNGLTISNNLIYDCTAGWCIHIYNETGSANTSISIINNTFADANPNRIGHVLLMTSMTNTLIANNIFYSPLTAGIQIATGFVYSNCLIKNNITYNGIISYGPTSGFVISNNLNNTNPLMASPSTYDFRLQAASPAINAGVNVGLTNDFAGIPLVGLPDIGAYESSTSGSSSPLVLVPTEASVYYNSSISGTATKNSCGTGYVGSTLTYNVPANKYSSTISQADADSKATADLTSNKQTYANTNGTCTIIPSTIYHNVQMSSTTTKNTCGTGYIGSTVTYTVSAGQYSSTISQADADAKATADLSVNKQSYANMNGTCTLIKKWKR